MTRVGEELSCRLRVEERCTSTERFIPHGSDPEQKILWADAEENFANNNHEHLTLFTRCLKVISTSNYSQHCNSSAVLVCSPTPTSNGPRRRLPHPRLSHQKSSVPSHERTRRQPQGVAWWPASSMAWWPA